MGAAQEISTNLLATSNFAEGENSETQELLKRLGVWNHSEYTN